MTVSLPASAGGAADSWLGDQRAVTALLFIAGFFAVQRFSIGFVSALVCLIPWCLFVLNLATRKTSSAVACLVLALAFSVDNGGETYAETPAVLRYLIYVSAVATLLLLSKWTLKTRAFLLGVLLVCCMAAGTVLYQSSGDSVFDAITFRRDVQVLLILSIFMVPRKAVALDLGLVYAGGLGYLLGEVVNGSLFYAPGFHNLSYDSLKVFAVFPLLYLLMTGRSRLALACLAALTVFVLSLYGTRMIIASALVLFMVAAMLDARRPGRRWFYLVVAIVCVALADRSSVFVSSMEAFASIKALSFLAVLRENFNEANPHQLLAVLDPVRFAEHELFFDRPWLGILFGNGPGSGLIDHIGYLDFTISAPTAFTEEELRSAIYFNFHDFWIDFGLRFGLLPVAVLMFCLTVREMWRGRPWVGVLFGMLLLNSTFAISGLILTALMVRFMPAVVPAQPTVSNSA